MSLTIDSLPNEVLFDILGKLDKPHLIIAGATCRLWRQIILCMRPIAPITNPIQAAINLFEYKSLYRAILEKLTSTDFANYSSIKFDLVMQTRDATLIKKVTRRAPELLRFMFIKAIKTGDVGMLDILDGLYKCPKILDKMYRSAGRFIGVDLILKNTNNYTNNYNNNIDQINDRYRQRGIAIPDESCQLHNIAKKIKDPATANMLSRKYTLPYNTQMIQELIINNNLPMLSWWARYPDVMIYITLYKHLCTSIEFAIWVTSMISVGSVTKRESLDYVFNGLLGQTTMTWFLCDAPVLKYLVGTRKLAVMNLNFIDKLLFMKKGPEHIINTINILSNLPLGYYSYENCIIYDEYIPDNSLAEFDSTAPPTHVELMARVLYSGLRNNTFDVLNELFPSDAAIKPYITTLVRLLNKRWGVLINRESINWLNQFESAARVCPQFYRKIGSVYGPRIMATCIFLQRNSWTMTRNVTIPNVSKCVLL